MQLMYHFQPTLMFNISSFNLVPTKKVSVFGVILVPIFLKFTGIWTEYGHLLRSELGLLGKGKLIFCCTGIQENYFGTVGQQNNNNK